MRQEPSNYYYLGLQFKRKTNKIIKKHNKSCKNNKNLKKKARTIYCTAKSHPNYQQINTETPYYNSYYII